MTSLNQSPAGAMISPYPPAADLTNADAAAIVLMREAGELIGTARAKLHEAARVSWAAADALQDALGMADELPGVIGGAVQQVDCWPELSACALPVAAE